MSSVSDSDTSCDDEATEKSTRVATGNVHSDNGVQESVVDMARPVWPENSTRGGPGDVQTNNGAQESLADMTGPASPEKSALGGSSMPLQDQQSGEAPEIVTLKIVLP